MERWKRLPDSELEVMLIIWDGKEKVSTSDIMQHLKEKKSVQLVQNALNRLEGKGFVQCEKIGRLNHYFLQFYLKTNFFFCPFCFQ